MQNEQVTTESTTVTPPPPDEYKIQKRRERYCLKQFFQLLPMYIVTTRFTNETIRQNREYCKKKSIPGIYGSPQPITKEIPSNAKIIVLEMNNDINQIEGIAYIRNNPIYDKCTIYENMNFNRFTYVAKKHVLRKDMTEEEEEIMQILDHICFYGNKHSKRGANIKQFPIRFLYNCQHSIPFQGTKIGLHECLEIILGSHRNIK
jgi:hypothetical protein